MLINDRLQQLNMTKYRLSKESGVPQATINDICNEKPNSSVPSMAGSEWRTDIMKTSVRTIIL